MELAGCFEELGHHCRIPAPALTIEEGSAHVLLMSATALPCAWPPASQGSHWSVSSRQDDQVQGCCRELLSSVGRVEPVVLRALRPASVYSHVLRAFLRRWRIVHGTSAVGLVGVQRIVTEPWRWCPPPRGQCLHSCPSPEPLSWGAPCSP